MKRLAAAALIAAALPARAETGNRFACIVHHAPEAGRLATCTGQASTRHGAWTFVLRGRAPNIVTRIEIYEPGRDTPRQVIDGFELRPPLVRGDGREPGRVAFILQDVNFDRHNDLRLAIGPPAAEGTAYRWFLFDPAAGAYVPTTALDALRDPVFNPRRKLVQGAFKDERGRTGRIAFKWRAGKLEPVGAVAHERSEDGRCIASHYTVREGKFAKLRESECRAGGE